MLASETYTFDGKPYEVRYADASVVMAHDLTRDVPAWFTAQVFVAARSATGTPWTPPPPLQEAPIVLTEQGYANMQATLRGEIPSSRNASSRKDKPAATRAAPPPTARLADESIL
jgi:hypothetical protein